MFNFFLILGNKLPSVFIMATRIAMMAAKFALALYLARYMGLESLGLYGLLASAVAALPVLFRAGIFNILSRDSVTQSKEDLTLNLFRYYVGVLVIYVSILPIVIGASFFVDLGFPILLVYLLVIIEHIVIDWFYLLISLRRPVRSNLMLFAQAGGWMFAFMLCSWFWPEMRTISTLLLFWAGGGLFSIATTLGIWAAYPWKNIPKSFSKQWYLEKWKSSRLYYVGDIANAGSVHIDRYLVGIVLGLEWAGVYVFFWQMANAVYTLVTTGVLHLYRPLLIDSYHKNNNSPEFLSLYAKSLKRIALSSLFLSLSVVFIAPYVADWADKPQTTSSLPVLWLLLSAMFLKVLSDGAGNALFAQRRDTTLIGSNLVAMSFVTGFVFIGLKVYGLYGAAISLIAVNTLLFLYRNYRTRESS